MKKLEISYPTLVFYLTILVSVIVIGQYFLGKSRYLHEELIGTKQKYEKLSKNSAILEVNYQKNLKDLKDAQNLVDSFKKEIDLLKGRVRVLSDATFLIKERARKTNKSDVTYVSEDGTYLVNEIRFNNGPAVGFITINKDGDVISKLYNHEINLKTATSVDDKTGKYTIINKASWILKSPSLQNGWFNKPFPLEITGGKAFVDPIIQDYRYKLRFFNPTIGLSTQISSKTGIGLGISFITLGKTSKNATFKFLELGLTYKNKELYPYIAPILYRPWENVLHNTYIGPYFLYDNQLTPYFGININL